MKTMYPAQANSPVSELAAAIDGVQTTITLVDASRVPAPPNLLTIGTDESAETILYTGKSGNDLTGVTRGFQVASSSWPAGTKVARNLTAYDIDAMRENIQSITSETINKIPAKLIGDIPGAYPVGVSVFSLSTAESAAWKAALGHTGTGDTTLIETSKVSGEYAIVQRVVFSNGTGVTAVFERTSYANNQWTGAWTKVVSRSEFDTFKDDTTAQLADLVYNVKKYGAKGDGSNDDTASIQTAIDAASAAGGGTVFFPKGTYIIKSTLQYRSKVNLIGCASRFCSNLVWNSEFGGVILDTTNVPTSQSVFENLAFYRGTIAHNAGAIVTGILGGSNFNVYNSGLAIFRNLLFHDLEYGIRGNGIIESSDIDAIGLFDCQFENLWFSDNSVGFWVHGSGNTVINSRFSGCNIGLYLDYLSRQSAAGVQLFGGVFAGNGYDISLPDARGIRSSSFFGVWFETSVSGIINIPFADTYVGALGFKNCVLSSDTPIFGLANFYNAVGVINIEGCNVIQSASSDVAIVRPNHINSKLKISNSWEKLSNGTERLLDDNAVDQRSYVHVFQSVKQSIGAATFTTVNFDSVVYDNQSEFDMALDRFVCKSSGIYQVFASVRLETQPAGNRALLAIYKNGASELVLYDENNGTSGVSALSGSGLIRMQKGDYLELKIHSTNAVSIAAGAYNSNYLQISKLSD